MKKLFGKCGVVTLRDCEEARRMKIGKGGRGRGPGWGAFNWTVEENSAL